MSKSKHYVSNTEFLEELKKMKKTGVVSEKLGDILLKIARHRISTRQFSRSWQNHDDMVQSAVMHAIRYIDKFDTEKYNNPFAYFTTLIYNSFLRSVTLETEYKYKQTSIIMSELKNIEIQGGEVPLDAMQKMGEFMHHVEEKELLKKQKQEEKLKSQPVS